MSTETYKVLVTGASGFLGGHVVRMLLEAGHVVRGTVRSWTDAEKTGAQLTSLCPGSSPRLELVRADLSEAETWLPAVQGMDYVIHTACPSPDLGAEPGAEAEGGEGVVRVSVEGTRHVLAACQSVSTVRRVVITSSVTAVHWTRSPGEQVFSEDSWTDPDQVDTAARGKVLTEKAAWDFMKILPDGHRLELVVINPAVMLGPPLHHTHGVSTKLLQRLIDRLVPAVPKMNFPLADVRDVARAHLLAMTSPEAAGHRNIVCAGNMWMSEIANLLHCVLGDLGYSIPTIVAPDFVMRLASKLDAAVKTLLPQLGLVHRFNTSRMRDVLGLEPRSMRDSVVEMAHAMIHSGLAHRSALYTEEVSSTLRQKYLSIKL